MCYQEIIEFYVERKYLRIKKYKKRTKCMSPKSKEEIARNYLAVLG